ncbi:phospholipase A2 inhibitor gamma subunit B-like [Notamacropus eugenii]|uniref:phospholipase A2 inhibitor gamma subunit B-like n=1 Tax=Notamacropus eugenii TaxID=9315 RepID=UPI003B67BE7C
MLVLVLGHLFALVTSGEPTTISETTSKPKNTSCYYCTDSDTCTTFLCPAGKDTCLSTVEFMGPQNKYQTIGRNGSCVASKDCQPQVYSLSYEAELRAWVNVTCCSGGTCSEPPMLVTPPMGRSSDMLCPICYRSFYGSCDERFYLLCFEGETFCAKMNLLPNGGGQNVTIQGCGSENLCQLPENHPVGLSYHLIGKPQCFSKSHAILEHKCRRNAAAGSVFGPLLPALLGV